MVARSANPDLRRRQLARYAPAPSPPRLSGARSTPTPPDVGFRRAAAQRVLANQVIAENEVNVGAWRPRRQFSATRVGESERYDVVSDRPAPLG